MATTYTPIATQTLGTATSSITFSSIPSTYTDLILVVGSLSLATNGNGLVVRYNSDTAANYSYGDLLGIGSGAGIHRNLSNTSSAQIGWGQAGSQGAKSTVIAQIMNYSNTTTYKTAISRWNDSSAEVGMTSSNWRNTAAINSITVLSGVNMAVGTTFSLYGIKAA
jgi:hypothetical protein